MARSAAALPQIAPLRHSLIGLSALLAIPALAGAQPLSRAVLETFTCANLAPSIPASPEIVHRIGQAIALVHNTGSLPEGAARARVVLRLCFAGSLDQPVIDLIDYSGPVGAVERATEAAARRSVLRALRAGPLTGSLTDLARGQPHRAVIDLVFGPQDPPQPGTAQ